MTVRVIKVITNSTKINFGMTDVHEPKVRSYNMSRIGSGNTKPEIQVRKYLHNQGFRFILHDKRLPGKPDIVLPKYRTVIFVHGCFWHGHKRCKYFVMPKTNQTFWVKKITSNVKRDRIIRRKLKGQEWMVISIWECELRSYSREKALSRLVKKILNTIH